MGSQACTPSFSHMFPGFSTAREGSRVRPCSDFMPEPCNPLPLVRIQSWWPGTGQYDFPLTDLLCAAMPNMSQISYLLVAPSPCDVGPGSSARP